MPGRIASDVLLTPSARIPSPLGRRIAPDIALPGLGADCREGCDAAASRAPGGTATGKPTTQTSTKVDDALDEALAQLPRPNLRVMAVAAVDVDMPTFTGTSETNKLSKYLRSICYKPSCFA